MTKIQSLNQETSGDRAVDLTRWTEDYPASGAYPRYLGWSVVVAPAQDDSFTSIQTIRD